MNSSNRLWRILELVNFALDVMIIFFVIAGPWIVAPAFVQVLGRAHPLVLHFPIVLILLLPVIPWIISSLSTHQNEDPPHLYRYIQFVHLTCALTVFFGLILSLENGYAGREVEVHKWGGLLVLAGIIALENSPWIRKKAGRFNWMVLGIPALILVVTSHIGAGITHGQGFLTEPITQKYAQKVPLDEAMVFQDVIYPILDQKCLNCHNSAKTKGELSLVDSASILRGGESGVVLVAGNPEQSLLFERLILDIDHEDHMPPKGKPQLTQQEITLIREWIDQQNLFDLAYHSIDPSDTLSILIKAHYGKDTGPVYDMKPARKSTIQELNDNYRLLIPLAIESPALYARFLSASHFQPEHLEALAKVRDQVVDLYLGHMPMDDESLTTVAGFQNLQVLNLNGTEVTDGGLVHLQGLKELQKLYVTETEITENGLRNMLQVNPVKKIYVWNASVDSNSINNLSREFPGVQIIGESTVFGNEIIALNSPTIKPESSFYESTMELVMEHPIPGVELRYTTDHSDPDSLNSPLYDGPITIRDDIHVKVKAFKSGWISSPVLEKSYLATRHKPDSVWFESDPNPRYTGNGPGTVIDLLAGEKVHEDKNYLAYRENEGIIGFAFDQPIELQKIILSGLTKTPSYIFPPAKVEVEFWDGNNWVKSTTEAPEMLHEQVDYEKYYISVQSNQPVFTDKLRLSFSPVARLPDWHPGKGDKGWVFVDEVLFQ